jgi:hypothetical protein
MFVSPGEKLYEGMIIGIHSRDNDLVVNPIKGKQLTNVRASGKDEAIMLTPPIQLTLESAVEFIADDELVEITPKSIRIRKRFLKEHERGERDALVEHVIHHQHRAAGNGGARLDDPRQLATGGGVAVAGDVQVVELQRKSQQRQQLAGEDHRAAHDGEHQRVGIAQGRRDLARDATHRRGGVLLGNDQVSLAEDLPCRGRVQHQARPPTFRLARYSVKSLPTSGCLRPKAMVAFR